MATILGVYNQALAMIDGQRELSTVSDATESQRVITLNYAAALAHCLEQGVWNFAIRSSTETYDASITTGGYQYSFTKPTDWVRTAMISADPQFSYPLLTYADEGAVIRSDVTTLYLKYVSNDAAAGGGLLTRWPQYYTDYVAANLALRACPRLAPSAPVIDRIAKIERKAKNSAQAKDAMNDPPGFPPTGSWVLSRRGRNNGKDQRRDNSV